MGRRRHVELEVFYGVRIAACQAKVNQQRLVSCKEAHDLAYSGPGPSTHRERFSSVVVALAIRRRAFALTLAG
jgi:hypothetical protein